MFDNLTKQTTLKKPSKKCPISVDENIAAAKPSMNSKICNAEISQVLEKQAGAECVEEVIAAKPSV